MSNWSRDQSISSLQISPGRFYPETLSLANKMTEEWSPILGQSTVRPDKLKDAVRHFVTIPESRKVTQEENVNLMEKITAEDIESAILSLQRRKSGGLDVLNNAFYRDMSAVMKQTLPQVVNDMLAGKPPPQSFLEALVIPLHKNGDSAQA